MTALLALVLLGAVGSKIPSDADIAAHIEAAIRQQWHPASVQVTVHRRSPLSTTVEQVEIAVSGFTLDGPANAPSPAPVAPPAAPRPPREQERQIRIISATLRCTHFTAGGLPIQELTLTGQELRLPWSVARGGTFALTAGASLRGTVTVQESGIAQFLRTQPLPLVDPQVRLTRSGCRISGDTRWVIGVPVEVSGRLTARRGAVLYLDHPALKLSIVPLPELVTRRVLAELNPLADLNRDIALPAPLTIQRIQHLDGALRVEIDLTLPSPE